MERLTHEADFGLEDWEETLFFVKSDPNGAYNILDVAKYQEEPEFDEILKNVALRLAAYENTGLEPEEVQAIAGLASENCAKTADAIDKLLQDDAELKSYRELGPIDRLRELAQADKIIGKEVWAQAKYLNVFQTKPSLIQRRTIQYVSLLKGKDILCHTQTCAFPLNEIGKTVFLTREEAEAALRRKQDE